MSNEGKIVCAVVPKLKPLSQKSYECDCGKVFKRNRNFRMHMKTHSVNRVRYECKVCSKSFLTSTFLKDHENIHFDRQIFECDKCSKKFHGRANLRQHQTVHADTKFSCFHCKQSFTRKVTLAHHIEKFHLTQDIKQSLQLGKEYKRPFDEPGHKTNLECKRCRQSFETEAALKDHRTQQHLDIAQCKLCGKTFSHHGSLTYHRRVAHSSNKPFACTLCDMVFAVKTALDTHIRQIHTGEKPFICAEVKCGKSFFSAAALRSHCVSHSSQLLFDCDQCGKRFPRANAFKTHLRTHSIEKQFECNTCGKKFRQKFSKLRHEKTHDAQKTPFYCKFCGVSFSRKTEYAQHALCRIKLISSKQVSDLDKAEEMFDNVVEEIFS